jgi:hypothetical protein
MKNNYWSATFDTPEEAVKAAEDYCKIAYQNHLRKGDGLCWSRAGDYRAGWQDALAWKAMTAKGGLSEIY